MAISSPPPSGTGGPIPRGGKRYNRAQSREMAKRVAYFLSDFADALIESDMAIEVVAETVVATSPVVMDMAMKGIFR